MSSRGILDKLATPLNIMNSAGEFLSSLPSTVETCRLLAHCRFLQEYFLTQETGEIRELTTAEFALAILALVITALAEGRCHFVKEKVMADLQRIEFSSTADTMRKIIARDRIKNLPTGAGKTYSLSTEAQKELIVLAGTQEEGDSTHTDHDAIVLSAEEEKTSLSAINTALTVIHYNSDLFAYAGGLSFMMDKLFKCSVPLLASATFGILASVFPNMNLVRAFKKEQFAEEKAGPQPQSEGCLTKLWRKVPSCPRLAWWCRRTPEALLPTTAMTPVRKNRYGATT